jgi:undecaprenyl-diphosphatase
MPAQPIVAPSWRRACVVAIVAAAVLVAVVGVAVYDVKTTTAFDTWAARPLFDHIGERGRVVLLALTAPVITVGALAVIATVGALMRSWEVVALAIVGPTVAEVVTEFVLKPIVHRQITDGPSGYAYPSGHETGLVSLLVVLLLLLPRAQLSRSMTGLLDALLVLWAVLGAIGLVRGHFHFMTDTIGGIGVGVACVLGLAVLIDLGAPRLRRTDPAGSGQFTRRS